MPSKRDVDITPTQPGSLPLQPIGETSNANGVRFSSAKAKHQKPQSTLHRVNNVIIEQQSTESGVGQELRSTDKLDDETRFICCSAFQVYLTVRLRGDAGAGQS